LTPILYASKAHVVSNGNTLDKEGLQETTKLNR